MVLISFSQIQPMEMILMTKRLIEVVKRALEQDNTIAVSKEILKTVTGFTEDHMAYLGLKRNDLKRLERHGLAIRGYDNTPKKSVLGRTVAGHKVMWVLIGKAQQ